MNHDRNRSNPAREAPTLCPAGQSHVAGDRHGCGHTTQRRCRRRLANLSQRQMRRRVRRAQQSRVQVNVANIDGAIQPALRALRLPCLRDKFASRPRHLRHRCGPLSLAVRMVHACACPAPHAIAPACPGCVAAGSRTVRFSPARSKRDDGETPRRHSRPPPAPETLCLSAPVDRVSYVAKQDDSETPLSRCPPSPAPEVCSPLSPVAWDRISHAAKRDGRETTLRCCRPSPAPEARSPPSPVPWDGISHAAKRDGHETTLRGCRSSSAAAALPPPSPIPWGRISYTEKRGDRETPPSRQPCRDRTMGACGPGASAPTPPIPPAFNPPAGSPRSGGRSVHRRPASGAGG